MMKSVQEARTEGHAAAEAAARHAGCEWRNEAESFLQAFARTHREFIANECTVAAIEAGLSMPPSLRAWGAVIKAGQRAGWIESTGRYAPQPNAHATAVTVWRSCIYDGNKN